MEEERAIHRELFPSVGLAKLTESSVDEGELDDFLL